MRNPSDVNVTPPDRPRVQLAAVAAPQPRRRPWRWAYGLLAASVGLFVLTCGVFASSLVTDVQAQWLFALSSGLGLLGVGMGVVAFVRLKSAPVRPWGGRPLLVLGPVLGGLFFSLLGALLSVLATAQFTRGRQLRSRGKVLLPPVGEGGAWTTAAFALDVPADVCAGLAAQWRENGRTEHASVAAFSRVTLQLLALGAPPELIAAGQQDSLDEVRHTELCFSLAQGLDGQRLSPKAFPAARAPAPLSRLRTVALVQLAVDSLVDGAFHEGLSARVIAALTKRCEVPAIHGVLKEIAADEGRHAAHGWDVVEWCYREGGAPVAHAMRAAARALRAAPGTLLPEGARGGGWERFGIHGEALEAEAYAKARADLVRRVERLTEPTPRVALRWGLA